jgi:hypothetical protein
MTDLPGEAARPCRKWLVKGCHRAEQLLDSINTLLERRPFLSGCKAAYRYLCVGAALVLSDVIMPGMNPLLLTSRISWSSNTGRRSQRTF